MITFLGTSVVRLRHWTCVRWAAGDADVARASDTLVDDHIEEEFTHVFAVKGVHVAATKLADRVSGQVVYEPTKVKSNAVAPGAVDVDHRCRSPEGQSRLVGLTVHGSALLRAKC